MLLYSASECKWHKHTHADFEVKHASWTLLHEACAACHRSFVWFWFPAKALSRSHFPLRDWPGPQWPCGCFLFLLLLPLRAVVLFVQWSTSCFFFLDLSWSLLISFDIFWYFLISCALFWSFLISLDPSRSLFVFFFDLLWILVISLALSWSLLISLDPFWSLWLSFNLLSSLMVVGKRLILYNDLQKVDQWMAAQKPGFWQMPTKRKWRGSTK